MKNREPLSDEEIQGALGSLAGWEVSGGALVREFRFRDFSEALAFLVRVGVEAEKLDHHPELTNVYNRVRIRLTTHDAGNRVTPLDVELAGRISRLAGGN